MATKAKKPTVFELSGVSVNIDSCRSMKKTLRAFDHPLRQKMLLLMDKAKNKKSNVTNIIAKLKIEQSVASQMLAILRSANLVIHVRDSREKIYSVNYLTIAALNKAVTSLK